MRWGWMAALFCLTSAAAAQTVDTAPVVYDRDYFASFVPQNALDMVQRVPGFRIDRGQQRRGLAGAASNVLIDGTSPVVKAESIEDILRQIPAADVARIELIRGDGTSASNAQATRLNIIKEKTSRSAVWQTTLERAQNNRFTPSGQLSLSGRLGNTDYRVSGVIGNNHRPRSGVVDTLDPSFTHDERRIEKLIDDTKEQRLSGEFKFPFGSGVVKLNGRLSLEEETEREGRTDFDAMDSLTGREILDAAVNQEERELTVSYSHAFGAWENEYTALLLRSETDEDEFIEEFTVNGSFDESAQELQTIEEEEVVLRVVGSRELSNGDFQLETEIAYNTLGQTLDVTLDDGSGPIALDLPGADTDVEEIRGELSAIRSWQVGDLWRIEFGAAVERSRLSFEGDVSSERTLTYWKPTLQLSRSIGDDDQIRLRIYRDVGQLDFQDFAAGVQLGNDEVQAGNVDLQPETSWRAELTADWRFPNGAIDIKAYAWAIEDAFDNIIAGDANDRFSASGNIGDGKLYGLQAQLEVPVPFLNEARFSAEGIWQDSEVTDPLTGENRPQSQITENSINLELRQDITSRGIAWGVEADQVQRAPEFLFDRTIRRDFVYNTEIWVETTRIERLKIRLYAENLSPPTDMRERTRFDADRFGPIRDIEQRNRKEASLIGLRVQGEF